MLIIIQVVGVWIRASRSLNGMFQEEMAKEEAKEAEMNPAGA